MSKDRKYRNRITVQLTDEMARMIASRAKEYGVSEAQVVRRMLEDSPKKFRPHVKAVPAVIDAGMIKEFCEFKTDFGERSLHCVSPAAGATHVRKPIK